MNIEEVREYGLSLPHATERCPFGPDTLALEIGGKMFCLMELSGRWDFYNVKVDPEFSVELQSRYASVRPGYHMNKRHWISIDFNGDVPRDVERQIIAHARLCTARGLSRRLRAALGLD